MANYHHGLQPGVLLQDFSKIGETGLRSQSGVSLHLSFVTKFVADQRRGLCAAFQWAGDDCFDLNVQRHQGPPDVTTLLDALLIEGAFFIFFGIREMFASACMS
jgi:hypothetical protein